MNSSQQPHMNVDFNQTTSLACDECGHETFTQVFFIRRLSALLSPSGEESLIPVPTFACAECGHVNEGLKAK